MRNSIEASCRLGNAPPSEHADFCARPEEAPATDEPGQRHNKANPYRKIMKLVVGASLMSAQRAATSPSGHQSIKCHHHHQQVSSAKFTLVVVGTSSLLFLLLLALPQVPCNAQETSRPAESLASSSSGQQVDLKEHQPSSGRSNPSEPSEDKRQPTGTSPLDDQYQDRDDEEEPHKLSTRLPRQHFRLKVGPTSRASSSFRLVNIRRRAAQQQKQQQQGSGGRNWQATKQAPCKADCVEGNGVEVPVANPPAVVIRVSVGDDGAADSQAQKPPQKSRKLSSAALKKLLAHTLPRLDGGGGESADGSDGSSKAPNFKFVFIQRATRVPSGSSQESSANNNNNRKTGQSGAGTAKPQQQSLAASVSRQLASSLFYSAANFISPNFTQTAAVSPGVNLIPSLSTLAALSSAMRPSSAPDHQSSVADNELVQQAGPGTTTAKTQITSGAPTYPTQQGPPSRTLLANNEDTNSNHIDRDETSNNNSNNLDIKRLSRPPSSAPTSQQQQQATKTKPKKSRPSKVYNLPVKFVSNGQPNSVMFQSIKQHFATIKKFQQQQQHGSNNKLMGSETGKARKKLPTGQTRLKGTNSRLIYLPLKYLSNAKPSMLSKVISGASSSGNGAKASHKSSSSPSSSALGTKSIRLH